MGLFDRWLGKSKEKTPGQDTEPASSKGSKTQDKDLVLRGKRDTATLVHALTNESAPADDGDPFNTSSTSVPPLPENPPPSVAQTILTSFAHVVDTTQLDQPASIDDIRGLVKHLVDLDQQLNREVDKLLKGLLPEIRESLKGIEGEMRQAQQLIRRAREDQEATDSDELKARYSQLIAAHEANLHALKKTALLILTKLFSVMSIKSALDEINKDKERTVDITRRKLGELETFRTHQDELRATTHRVHKLIAFATTGIDDMLNTASPEILALVKRLVHVHTSEARKLASALFENESTASAAEGAQSINRRVIELREAERTISDSLAGASDIHTLQALLDQDTISDEVINAQLQDANTQISVALGERSAPRKKIEPEKAAEPPKPPNPLIGEINNILKNVDNHSEAALKIVAQQLKKGEITKEVLKHLQEKTVKPFLNKDICEAALAAKLDSAALAYIISTFRQFQGEFKEKGFQLLDNFALQYLNTKEKADSNEVYPYLLTSVGRRLKIKEDEPKDKRTIQITIPISKKLIFALLGNISVIKNLQVRPEYGTDILYYIAFCFDPDNKIDTFTGDESKTMKWKEQHTEATLAIINGEKPEENYWGEMITSLMNHELLMGKNGGNSRYNLNISMEFGKHEVDEGVWIRILEALSRAPYLTHQEINRIALNVPEQIQKILLEHPHANTFTFELLWQSGATMDIKSLANSKLISKPNPQ